MKKFVFLAAFFSLLLSGLPAIAEDQPPEGMEYIQITNGYRILVPKGTQMVKNGAAVAPERIDAYAARRFQEMEGRFKKIDESLFQLKGEIEQLKSAVTKIEEKLPKS